MPRGAIPTGKAKGKVGGAGPNKEGGQQLPTGGIVQGGTKMMESRRTVVRRGGEVDRTHGKLPRKGQ